jgi:hypothetical protein
MVFTKAHPDITVDKFLSGIAVEIKKRTGEAVERDT